MIPACNATCIADLTDDEYRDWDVVAGCCNKLNLYLTPIFRTLCQGARNIGISSQIAAPAVL